MMVENPKKIEVPSGCGTEKLTRIDFLRQIVNLPKKREPKKSQSRAKSERRSEKT